MGPCGPGGPCSPSVPLCPGCPCLPGSPGMVGNVAVLARQVLDLAASVVRYTTVKNVRDTRSLTERRSIFGGNSICSQRLYKNCYYSVGSRRCSSVALFSSSCLETHTDLLKL